MAPDIRDAAYFLMPDVGVVRTASLPGGSSAVVIRVDLQSPGGERRTVVFRQHADRAIKEHTKFVAAKEFHLTKLLADEGFEVPRPLALHGEDTANGPWLVTEWIEGSTFVEAADVDNALSQMALFLARLHALDPERVNAPGLTEVEDPTKAVLRYLAADAIGDAIARALGVLQRRPNRNVLIHGDFWPGNVMFHDRVLVAVLDWEDAKWGDPLVDLACARVELSCAYGQDASEQFTARYLAVARELGSEPSVSDLPLWDIYVSAAALSAMHQWGLSPHDESRRRDATQRFLGDAAQRLLAN